MGSYFKLIGYMALFILTIAIFQIFMLPLLVGGKVVNRQAQKFDAETSAQVYDNSRQYQQGINRDVARYCREYQAAESPAKRAVADLIRSTLDTYQGELTPTNADCVSQIEGN